jgi:hypothetical protein
VVGRERKRSVRVLRIPRDFLAPPSRCSLATQAALGALPPDVLAEIDSFRRRRARRAKTAHARERLYLAQERAISLRRKATALGAEVWIPFPHPPGRFVR